MPAKGYVFVLVATYMSTAQHAEPATVRADDFTLRVFSWLLGSADDCASYYRKYNVHQYLKIDFRSSVNQLSASSSQLIVVLSKKPMQFRRLEHP